MAVRELLAIDGLLEQSEAFRRQLVILSDRVQADPSFVAAVIRFESRFDPAARNPYSGATGLIQFMPSTAKLLGTTTDELAAMGAVEQLAYVESYFAKFKGRLHTASDHYLAVFAPIGIGKPYSAALYEAPSKAYEQNKALDAGDDGVISVGDATAPVRRLVEGAQGRPPIFVDVSGPSPPADDEGDDGSGIAIAGALGLVAALAVKRWAR